MGRFIPLSVPNLKGNERKYADDAIEKEWVSTGGAYIDEFEKVTAKYVNTKGAVACQSGTSGLHLALMANGIEEKDGVIVPTLTFIAAVNPVKYIKAIPFFMDCDDTLCMDMNKVCEFCEQECEMQGEHLVHIVSGVKIKAIIVVHIFGNIADVQMAKMVCEKYNLVLIEDATEALGSYMEAENGTKQFAGTFGSAGVFSYNGNKIITTGGGGMIVSNNAEFLAKIKYLSTQAKDDNLYYVHNEIGYNYRMTNVQAAIGIGQMEQLESFIKIKNNNYSRYIQNGIELLPFRAGTRPNYWFYSYLTDKRDELIQKLQEKGIQTRPVWHLINELTPYKDEYCYKIEKAKYYQQKIINLPCSTNLDFEDIDYVCEQIKEFENEFK